MTIRRLALVQLSVGVLLGLAYAVLVGPTLVDVWTTDAPDNAMGQFFFGVTALVAAGVVGYALLTAWVVWRSARADARDGPTAQVMLILQAVCWGGGAVVVGVGLFGSFEARPASIVVATSIAAFSILAAWLVARVRD
jgi:hypothetical protein